MKKNSLFSMIAIISFIMQGCVKDSLKSTYTYYSPVYTSKTEVWQNIKSAPPRPLQKTGKLFLFGKFIFINEINKGVHIIDNTNPRQPNNISFISIPGNLDIAVKDNTLYADLFTDMITIDIKNPVSVQIKKVSSGVFPERDYYNSFMPDTTKYITDWIRQQTSDEKELQKKVLQLPVTMYTASQAGNSSGISVVGISGSMARFTIVNDFLYTVGRSNLTAFDISSAANPIGKKVETLGWNIETIYPLKDKLFIGSQTGMFIYNISDPANPVFAGNFSHACFNDPVIADDHYAYITLRARTDVSSCWGAAALQRNELDIVNIGDILQPSLVKIYDMAEPKGLAKDGDHLFICDGKEGLKIFEASNVMDIKRLKTIGDINPFDVICQNGLAIVVADEGIYQYDYTDINDIKFVSKISTDKQ